MRNEGKGQRLALQLGVALAVTAIAPVGELVSSAATPAEKLEALREAAKAGCLTLLCRDEDGQYSPVARQRLAQTFDRSVIEGPRPP